LEPHGLHREKFAVNVNKDKIMEVQYLISPDNWSHMRISYSLINMIGDIGGVHGTIVHFFGIFFFSISKFSFTMSIIKNFFLIGTKEKGMFQPPSKKVLFDNNYRIKGVQKYISAQVIS
jgi:hypothetical protein